MSANGLEAEGAKAKGAEDVAAISHLHTTAFGTFAGTKTTACPLQSVSMKS